MILDAAKTIEGFAHRTPILTSSTINHELTQLAVKHQGLEQKPDTPSVEVFFKCENLQKAGSFKIRGALNAISKLTPEQKSKGVLAYSAGNHGQGIAMACRRFGIKCKVICPYDAPALKLDAMRGYGAELL